VLVALAEQVDVVEDAVVPVVLHVQQARSLGLDAHVDVLGHQADEGPSFSACSFRATLMMRLSLAWSGVPSR
jgi:hypothetical protein